MLTICDIKNYCQLPPNSLIVEIGAHHGEDTEAFLREYPEAFVCAIEADPRCIIKLKERLGNHPRCRIYECAISNVNGESDWYQSGGFHNGQEDWDYSSSLLKPKCHLDVFPTCTFDKIIQVKTNTLDSIIKQPVDFLWMDVQGAEHLVFDGAKETLKQTRYIYTECEEIEMYEGEKNLEGLSTILQDFSPIGFGGSNVLFKNNCF